MLSLLLIGTRRRGRISYVFARTGTLIIERVLAPWTIKAIAIRMNRKFWPKIREEHGPYKWEHISYELNEHRKYYRRKYWQVINDENALLAEGY